MKRLSLFLLVLTFFFYGCNSIGKKENLRFGVCADVHKDIMHDSDQRLQIFIDQMNENKVDFVIQLGDFCRPYDFNQSFMDVWKSFNGPVYNVLGNHDMEDEFTREQTIEYWGMPAKYYSFDLKGYHFIILDGNDKRDPPQSGYARYMGIEQMEWLREDLNATRLTAVIFSHQSIEDPGGIENANEIRKILEDANQQSKKKRVIACVNGHHHSDRYDVIKGIYYVNINSLSYQWLGGDYLQVRYSEEIDEKFPWIKYTAPYKDPVYATVTLEPDGTIKIEGTQSEWVGPSPQEMGYPVEDKTDRIVPGISDKILKPLD